MRQRWLWTLAAGVAVALSVAFIASEVASNRSATDQIQAERQHSIRMTCELTNSRNIATKKVIRQRFPNRQVRAVTFLVIDALVPHQNCDALVNSRVSSR